MQDECHIYIYSDPHWMAVLKIMFSTTHACIVSAILNIYTCEVEDKYFIIHDDILCTYFNQNKLL